MASNPPIPGTSSANLGQAPTPPRLGRLGYAPRVTQIRDVGGKFQSGFGFNWIGLIEVARLFEALDRVPTTGSAEIMRQVGEKAIDWAKTNARWQDDSGEARGEGKANTDETSLHYNVTPEGQNFTLNLSHGVPYGVYLEANPEFSILAEALVHATDIYAGVAEGEMVRMLGPAWRR